MNSFPRPPAAFTDGGVSLRSTAERDIPEILIAYQDDRDLHRRLGEERPPSGAELGRRAECSEVERQQGRSLTLTILEGGSDVCAGQLRVHQVDWEQGRAEVGIWVGPERRDRGLARRALRLVGEWLLGECGLRQVELVTEAENQQMARSARAAGFVQVAEQADRVVFSLSGQDLSR